MSERQKCLFQSHTERIAKKLGPPLLDVLPDNVAEVRLRNARSINVK